MSNYNLGLSTKAQQKATTTVGQPSSKTPLLRGGSYSHFDHYGMAPLDVQAAPIRLETPVRFKESATYSFLTSLKT